MSYAIRHRTEWDWRKISPKEMHQAVAALMDTTPDHAETIMTGGERDPWRNREEDMETVSVSHPQTLITVNCEGEDGERWVEYYKGGKSYSQGYVAPEFDESRMS